MKVACCQEHIEDVAYCLWSCVRASKPAGCDGILGVSTLTNRKPCHDLSWPIRVGPAPPGYQVSESCQSGSICLCQDIPQSVRLLRDWVQPLISHEIPEQLSSENLAPLPVRASYQRERAVLSALSAVMPRLTGETLMYDNKPHCDHPQLSCLRPSENWFVSLFLPIAYCIWIVYYVCCTWAS